MAAPLIGMALAAAAGPIVKKVLVALGVGIVSYAGLSLVLDQVKNAVLGAWGQVGGVTLQILSLGGIPESIGIVLGALAARLALIQLERFGRVAS